MTERQRKCWRILGCNSLFGYQFECGTQDEHFAICFCDDDMPAELVGRVMAESGAVTLVQTDFIGHGFLKIHMSDLERVPAIFTSLLANGQWFRTNNNAKVGFNPSRGDREFSDEIMERKFIEQVRADILGNDSMRRLCAVSRRGLISSAAFKIWNYASAEGRQLCHDLRALVGKGPANPESKNNYWNWKQFSGEVEDEVPPPEKRARGEEEEGDEEECMICLDRAPDTRVEPCGCQVVCAQCSAGLAATADAHICVHCRRPITGVVAVE